MNRREFLSIAAAGAALAPQSLTAADPTFDADFGSALAAAEAIRKKKISSVELTTHCFERIAKYDRPLNSMVVQLRERAMERAKKADATIASGAAVGTLHGVPVTLKESFNIVGVPTTWGIKDAAQFKPTHNSAATEKLEGAGAIVIGKTNVPVRLADWQSYNPVYGSSQNPWDLKRTPGGSTGGGAAALAAGFGFLTMGTDIGGSIRIPSHFCGVYGHKPTLELVSLRGHTTPPQDADVRGTSDLSVAGPMARSADDLAAALRVVGGQDGYETAAWKWSLPAPRHRALKDFRIGIPGGDGICPVSSDLKEVLGAALAAIRKTGAKIDSGWPQGVDPAASLETYRTLLGANMYSRLPKEQLEPMRKEWERNPRDPMLSGVFAPHQNWVMHAANQRMIRFAWHEYFKSHDVFLMPVAFAPAVLKDESEPLEARKIATPDGPRDYTDLVVWVSFATLAGIPATSAPVGRTREGLPVALQILGPMWEDATPIEFAARLAELVGGFERPKGY